MFVPQLIGRSPRLITGLVAVGLAFSLLAGCTEPPDGIEAAGDSPASGAMPDTVAVPVDGEAVEGDLQWTPPPPRHKAWLAEHDYEKLHTQYSEDETKELWAERLRVLRGLVGVEHIPESRHAVVHRLSREALGRDELLHIDIGDQFDADRFQTRLEKELGMQNATRNEVQARLDALNRTLDDYEERQVVGHAYYAQAE